jgi:DNA mismatch repair protein MutL
MPKIRVLDNHTINKIAAGEVIENPASVVKELVENALDAGSTEICVEIMAGGRELIRISDNGCGMSSEDAALCMERHATSKLVEVEDLQDVLTMGFRGEAIPSIASVSKFTLLTSPSGVNGKNFEGTLTVVEGGRPILTAPAARSPGTTVEVKSLFFNVPVRLKFQKSPSFDTQEILKTLTLLSLGHPNIKFELISDQKQLLDTSLLPTDHSFQEKLACRIEDTLGRDFLSSLLPVSFERDEYSLQGFIGFPTFNRQNKTGQYLFVNRRAIQSQLISFAVRDGYGTTLPAARHPVFIAHLDLPGHLIDVNVHPQKREIRLRQEQKLKSFIIEAIQKSIQTTGFSGGETLDSSSESPVFNPFDNGTDILFSTFENNMKIKPRSEHTATYSHFSNSGPEDSGSEDSVIKEPAPLDLFGKFRSPPHFFRTTESQPVFQFIQKKVAPRILATLPGYLLLDPAELGTLSPSVFLKSGGGFCLLNQKLAYSRLYYERLMKSDETKRHIQPLLMPLILEFPPLEASLLKESLEYLNQMGFGIEEFGEGTFKVDALPDFLKKEDPQTLLQAIVQDLREIGPSKRVQEEREKRLAQAACRNTPGSDHCMTTHEALDLIERLTSCPMPLQCPFGRPIIVHLSSEDLIKLFQK